MADAANYDAAQAAAKARGTWVDPTTSSMTFAGAEEWMASNAAKRASSLDGPPRRAAQHLLPPLYHRCHHQA